MARPEERGLQYFPFNVDFFNDEKIEAISGEFGIKGEIVAVKLLAAIYRQGYFIEWSDLYKMKLLRNLPSISSSLLDNIILRLVKWGLFDENLFNSDRILTSRGIQRRYFEAVRRRKQSGTFPYLIVDIGTRKETKASVGQETPATVVPKAPAVQPAKVESADFFEDLYRETQLRENLCMRYHVTPEQLIERLEKFNLDCSCRGTVHDCRRDALCHFNDWLRIVLNAEAKQQSEQNDTDKTKSRNKRRGVKTTAATAEDYNSSF